MPNTENIHNGSSISFRERKVVPELIDDFKIRGKKLHRTLRELEWVNKWLGGIGTSVYPIYLHILKNHPDNLKIVDIGCGSGDILKKISDLGPKTNCKMKLTGIDANQHILDFARQTHFAAQPISLIAADVIHEPEKIDAADVYMFNQFLHHFELGKIQSLFNVIARYRPSLIVINDLERSKLAYHLFTWLCKIKKTSYLTSHDGQLSISKGFNEVEMHLMGNMIPGYNYTLKWTWAFRWQLVFKRDDISV
jgi:SAM-dependent methyltransferase